MREIYTLTETRWRRRGEGDQYQRLLKREILTMKEKNYLTAIKVCEVKNKVVDKGGKRSNLWGSKTKKKQRDSFARAL